MGSPKSARAWKPRKRKINLVTRIKGMGAVKGSRSSAKCPPCSGRKTAAETIHQHLIPLLSDRTVVGSSVKPRR